MTISKWLVESMVKLKKAEVPHGRREALIFLSDLLQKDKSWIHAHPEHELDDLQIRELDYKLEKRLKRTPLAYIRGYAEFYGRKFTVNSNVLIPRPESESFIDLLKTLDFETMRLADIGAGSGVLGITAALEFPDSSVHLYDIDPATLALAHHNARHYALYLHYFESDMLENLQPEPYDIFLVNLPYVPEGLVTSPEIKSEPKMVLFSGKDGLDHYRKFWSQVSSLKHKPKYILTEVLETQQCETENLAKEASYTLQMTDKLVQLFHLH